MKKEVCLLIHFQTFLCLKRIETHKKSKKVLIKVPQDLSNVNKITQPQGIKNKEKLGLCRGSRMHKVLENIETTNS
jgi:hypothetical protein